MEYLFKQCCRNKENRLIRWSQLYSQINLKKFHKLPNLPYGDYNFIYWSVDGWESRERVKSWPVMHSSPSLASANPHMEAVTQLKVIQVFSASNQLHTSEQRKTTITFPNFNSTVIWQWLKNRFSNIISYHCTKLQEIKTKYSQTTFFTSSSQACTTLISLEKVDNEFPLLLTPDQYRLFYLIQNQH